MAAKQISPTTSVLPRLVPREWDEERSDLPLAPAEQRELVRLRQEVQVLRAALLKSEARHSRLIEQAPVMMHCMDADGRITSVSDLWLATLGYRRDEVIGRRSTDFLTEASRRY